MADIKNRDLVPDSHSENNRAASRSVGKYAKLTEEIKISEMRDGHGVITNKSKKSTT